MATVQDLLISNSGVEAGNASVADRLKYVRKGELAANVVIDEKVTTAKVYENKVNYAIIPNKLNTKIDDTSIKVVIKDTVDATI